MDPFLCFIMVCLSLLWYALLCVVSSFARGRESRLLLLSYGCLVTVNVLWLFLRVSWVGLQCVIVVFPDHTHLLFVQMLILGWPWPTLHRGQICFLMHLYEKKNEVDLLQLLKLVIILIPNVYVQNVKIGLWPFSWGRSEPWNLGHSKWPKFILVIRTTSNINFQSYEVHWNNEVPCK